MGNQLELQMVRIVKNANDSSYQTKERYLAAGKRFAEFLTEKYHLQKFSNVSNKHLYAYTEKMLDEGLAPTMIKTELSAIRWLHAHCSSAKNRLATNKQLEIPDRHTGKTNRAYTLEELEKCKEVAIARGRYDVYYAVCLHSLFGCRNEGAVTLTLKQVIEARSIGFLQLREKGNKLRAVPVRDSQRQLIDDLIAYAKAQGRASYEAIIPRDTRKGSIKTAKRSIQDFLYRHRDEWTDKTLRESSTGTATEKPYSEHLSAHSGRYFYAQEMYKYLIEEEGCSEKQAKLKLSKVLGHERIRISDVYLSARANKGGK